MVSAKLFVILAILAVASCAPSNSSTSAKSQKNKSSAPQTSTEKPGSGHVRAEPGPIKTSTTKGKNSTVVVSRPVRDLEEDSHPHDQDAAGHQNHSPTEGDPFTVSSPQFSEGTETEQKEVPSTHHLFANRQASNITAVLRPKLRAPSNQKVKGTEEGSDEGPSSTVLSSGPVVVVGRNSTVHGLASGTGTGNKRVHEPQDDEEIAFKK